MASVIIEERGCRGCSLCSDICPSTVFDYDATTLLAKVTREVDCIGCYSCFYVCPSQCIAISGTHVQRPFYRVEENVAFIEKFVQEKTATSTLAASDWEEAYKDEASTMVQLSQAIVELMGRGTKALGRRSGQVAAAHLPEIYEETDLKGVLTRLQTRFKDAFDFDFETKNGSVNLTFRPCGLFRVVESNGEKAGTAVLCQLFHDYLAGLLGVHTGVHYQFEVPLVSCDSCKLDLSATVVDKS